MIAVRMFVNDYNDLNSIWQISVTATPCNFMSNLTFLGKEFSMMIKYFLVTTWQNGVLYWSTIYPNLQCMTAAYVHRLLFQVKEFFWPDLKIIPFWCEIANFWEQDLSMVIKFFFKNLRRRRNKSEYDLPQISRVWF